MKVTLVYSGARLIMLSFFKESVDIVGVVAVDGIGLIIASAGVGS